MKKFIALFVFLILLPAVQAHEDEVGFAVNGYKIELLSPENDVATGVDTNLEFRIEHTVDEEPALGLSVSMMMDPDVRLNLQERGEGTYYTSYKFLKPTIYEIHSAEINDEEFSVDFHIVAIGENYETTNQIFIAIPVLGLILAGYFVIRKSLKRALSVLLLSLIIAVLAYSVSVYFSRGAATEGIVVCNPNDPTDCTWQAHIHALIVPVVCGEEIRFGTEVGLLNQSHTHEERNVLHWHDRLPYDSTQSKILDTTPLRLDNSFNSIGFSVDTSKCSGELKVFVNEENYWTKNTQWRKIEGYIAAGVAIPPPGKPSPNSWVIDYVWSDREIIYMSFDNTTVQEVLDYLQTTQFSFPTLGPA